MSLLENPTTYNLSQSKFSLGVAIFDKSSLEFVDLDYFPGLLISQTLIGSALDYNPIYNDYKRCNTTIGDFGKINLNANVNKWKQGHLINSSMCFDMSKATLKSDYQLLGKGYELTFS
jgi:hypothetical protein